MNNIRRIALALILVILSVSLASAQPQPTVKWRARAHMTSDTRGTVTITASIADGWHLYGTEIPQGGPTPTQISFALKGVRLSGQTSVSPAPEKHFDDILAMELNWWTGKVTFTQAFEITDPNAPSIAVKVKYMTCDDKNCTPPKELTLNVKLNR